MPMDTITEGCSFLLGKMWTTLWFTVDGVWDAQFFAAGSIAFLARYWLRKHLTTR